MKARKRTKKVRPLFVFFLVCLLLAFAFAGIKFRFYSGENVQTEAAAPIQKEEEREEVIEGIADSIFPGDNLVKRKNIYDRNLRELALSFPLASVYVKPLEIRNDDGAVQKLAVLLDLDEKELSLSVSSQRGFVWVARNIEREMAEKIQKLGISGVYLVQEGIRLYPEGKGAAHVIGFSEGDQGLAGVESYYDNILAGNINAEAANMVAAGIAPEEYLNQDGASLVLTIDLRVQEYLEKKLASLIIGRDARSGMAMIMHSKTGEILALTNYPTFDSNLFWKSDSFERRNRILTDPVRTGAFSRLVRMAAEVERGSVPEFISEPEEISQNIIEPKSLKREAGGKELGAGTLIWKELDKGIYWPVLDKPFRFTLGENELTEFSEVYGLSEKGFADLPMNGLIEAGTEAHEKVDLASVDSSATGLQILTAFNRILQGGKRVVPHVLKDIWFEQQGKKVPASFEQGAVADKQEPNRPFIGMIHQLSAIPQKDGVFFETIVEDKDDALEHGLEFSKIEDLTGDGVEESDFLPIRRCQNMVLGAISSENPEIVMILIIDGMLVDVGKSSDLQTVSRQILKKGLEVYLADKVGKTPVSRMQEKEAYEKWNRLHAENDDRHVSKSSQAQEMPSVLNLSFRKALQILQNYNLRIRAEGSGRVAVQHPPPGTLLKGTSDCVLELRVDN